MSTSSKIEWTEATWNPVTGCTKVSPGCDHCYAERITERFHGPGSFERVELHEDRLDMPLRWRKPRRVFVNSMSDLFHDAVPDLFLEQVFDVMEQAAEHTFQVLTKRHARMRSFMQARQQREVEYAEKFKDCPTEAMRNSPAAEWARDRAANPPANIWLGVSVEDQKWADIRVPALVDTPAAVRFLSCEPLLAPLDLTAWMPPGVADWRCSGCHRFYGGPVQEVCPGCGREGYWSGSHTGNARPNGQPLGWVIAGGESGPKARPMHPDWARSLRDQCDAAHVPFFFKQWGAHAPWAPEDYSEPKGANVVYPDGRTGWVAGDDDHLTNWTRDLPTGWAFATRLGKKAAGRELDGRTWDEYPAAS
jgi:protein gp37